MPRSAPSCAGFCISGDGGGIQWAEVMNMHLLSLAPPETRSDTPRLVLTGREELLIEQHAGLFSYETRCVRVRTGAGLCAVTGENLVIAWFGVRDLLIRGKITCRDGQNADRQICPGRAGADRRTGNGEGREGPGRSDGPGVDAGPGTAAADGVADGAHRPGNRTGCAGNALFSGRQRIRRIT